MTAIAAVTLSTNVVSAIAASASSVGSVSYSPVGFVQPGVAKWADRSGGIPLLYPSLTVSVKLPSAGSKVCRIVTKLVLPTADVTAPSTSTGIQPAPSKAYECLAQLEMVFPERSTLAERNTLRSLVLSILSQQVQASDGDPVVDTASPLPLAIADFETPY
jgi:hypothetical protein